MLSGASEALRERLIEAIGDDYFRTARRANAAREAIFTRKIGHTQRGGRPLAFDRFYAAQLGGKAVEMLFEGQNDAVSILQWNKQSGFHVDSIGGHAFRDRWGHIHARRVHPSFYDPQHDAALAHWASSICCRSSPTPSAPTTCEHTRQTLFDAGNLYRPYHSVNTDINKRIRCLED